MSASSSDRRIPAARALAPTILIVEDTAETRELYAVAFASNGYRVLTAESGEAGLRVLRQCRVDQCRVDALVVDYDLPGATGSTFLHQAFNEQLTISATPSTRWR